KLRIRDAAKQLETSEAELLQTQEGVTRLRPEIEELLTAMPSLGKTMVLTRNEFCVHEKTGTWKPPQIGRHASLALGDIDLRMFLGSWKHVLAQSRLVGARALHSIQFFDAQGGAIMKVYAKDGDLGSYKTLVQQYSAPELEPIAAEPKPDKSPPVKATVDAQALSADWAKLQDTHAFYGLLRKHKVQRLDAFQACPDFAKKAQVDMDAFLRAAAEVELPIMVFVSNPGNIQIHSGPVKKILTMGDWVNVMDPTFNLHLNTQGIAEIWRVRKPTVDGDVNSLELYAEDGSTIAMLFGVRKEGRKELPAWRALLDQFVPCSWSSE
ncbi:MAG: putative hemin transport protein, partial [Cognaticolwellia sp.]